nr:PREDICTED: prostatic acid phosphatase-like [Bemisia tabaci]
MIKGKKASVMQNCLFQKKGAAAFIILVICTVTACTGLYLHKSIPTVENTLRFVSVIHRHGERSPLHSYPFDPYKGESYWPEGLRALLQKGKVNMYKLGKFLRLRYDSLLSTTYKPAEIFVSTFCTDRVIMSGQLVLAGLYPPVGIQIWKTDLLWQPIPIHSMPDSCDDMFHVTKRCKLLSDETKQRDLVIKKKLEDHQEFLAYLSKYTGLDVKNASHLSGLFDNLSVVEQQGLTLPQWTRDVYPKKLESLANLEFMELFKTQTMIKLESGVLINEIVSNMVRKTDASKNFERMLNLYPASDRILIRLWRGLNMTQEITSKPYYGAALFIELHEIDKKYRVKILHKKGTTDDELTTLKIRGCEGGYDLEQDEMCDLDVFLSALEPMIITDFDKACENST